MIGQPEYNAERIPIDEDCRHEAEMLKLINETLGDLELDPEEEMTWLWLACHGVGIVENILSVVDMLVARGYERGLRDQT